jgi:hypothetical protein
MIQTEEEWRLERRHAERSAVLLLGVGAIVLAIVCGAIIVSGWFAGVLQDQYERWFWLGSVLGLAMVVMFAVAAMPGGREDRRAAIRIRVFMRIGLILLSVSPLMCIGAMVADFYL